MGSETRRWRAGGRARVGLCACPVWGIVAVVRAAGVSSRRSNSVQIRRGRPALRAICQSYPRHR
jgi:hypothetical protein